MFFVRIAHARLEAACRSHLLVLLFVVGSLAGATRLVSAASHTRHSSKSKSAPTKKAATTKPEAAEKKDAGSDEKSSSASKNPDTDEDESPASKQQEESVTSATPATISALLEPVLQSASKAAHWGVKVMLQQSGQTLFDFNPDDKFIPASNRKIFTAALALDQLGPDFKFRSYLYRTGNVQSSGTLDGNLVLKPSGDPTFSRTMYNASQSDWVFRDWASKVAQAGIRYVHGDLLVDCSDWKMNDLYPQGWPARIMQDNYAPQTSPLALNENLITIVVNPGQKGGPGVISFAPAAAGYPIINQTITGGPGGVSVRRSPNGGPIVVSGGANRAGQGAELPCDNPTLFAAANFRSHLRDLGIGIQGSVRIITTKNAVPAWTDNTLIAAVESPPLSEILRYMMKHSDNHMAEQIYCAVSAHKMGRGSYSASRQLEDNLLQRAGINPREVQFYDGCGLSEGDRVSPDQVCKILLFAINQPWGKAYFDTMAIGGRDGTLRGRMTSSRLIDRVHAKTGTINGVKTLSGYLLVDNQHTLVFSFLVNNIRGGSAAGTQDRLCSMLVGLQF